eukprot:TRINITY_DN5330_c0_g1_i1.p1 TRINITY_DN5330_c0_g1~~TRINITY_DN5330_c0_g1_i1.p1  ORF type:complete len:336 (-),score=40.23 TRINITY_DN5330_c0_g1_i1:535-1542(-)
MPHFTAVRRWQVFEGKNVFHCNGGCIGGPDRKFFYLTEALILSPVVTFWASICPWWVNEYDEDSGIVISFFSVYLVLGSVISFYITAYMDPGIIPRAPPIPEDDMPWSTKKPPPFKKVNFGTQRIKVKYCATCRIYRPPRAIHCSICDNCIERFDHHCPWIGNCIGRRNYKFFLFFVYTLMLNCVYMTIFSLVQFIILVNDSDEDTGQAVLSAFRTSPLALPLALYCVIALVAVGILGVFHFYLICTGQTTNERLKGVYKKEKNPFNRGACKNFLFLCYQPYNPGYINFKEQILELEVRKVDISPATSTLSKASNNPLTITATDPQPSSSSPTTT